MQKTAITVYPVTLVEVDIQRVYMMKITQRKSILLQVSNQGGIEVTATKSYEVENDEPSTNTTVQRLCQFGYPLRGIQAMKNLFMLYLTHE